MHSEVQQRVLRFAQDDSTSRLSTFELPPWLFIQCGGERGIDVAGEGLQLSLKKREEHINGVAHQKRKRQRWNGRSLGDGDVVEEAGDRASDTGDEEACP